MPHARDAAVVEGRSENQESQVVSGKGKTKTGRGCGRIKSMLVTSSPLHTFYCVYGNYLGELNYSEPHALSVVTTIQDCIRGFSTSKKNLV